MYIDCQSVEGGGGIRLRVKHEIRWPLERLGRLEQTSQSIDWLFVIAWPNRLAYPLQVQTVHRVLC